MHNNKVELNLTSSEGDKSVISPSEGSGDDTKGENELRKDYWLILYLPSWTQNWYFHSSQHKSVIQLLMQKTKSSETMVSLLM